ncbi:hypothetical protein Tco_0168752 [Tanacetum coccineum]
MHVYWASVFTLPTPILLDIELIMRGFLWNHGTLRKGSSKVAWEIVCLPKVEGGLGIRRLECFNKALMAVHIWKLLTMKDSLWVTWIHIHKFKETATFGILHCRGKHVWDEGNPLADFISTRDMFRAGLNTSSKVVDIIFDGTLSWPQELGSKYPNLLSIQSPRVSYGVHDKLEWRFRSGSIKPFTVNSVWHSIRPRGVKVVWADVVWFSKCIPKYAFNLWLVIKGKLKTQDKLRSWDVSNSLTTKCSLCDSQPDSHEHLFFDCSFSRQVWCHMRDVAGMSHVPPSLELILDYIIPIAKRRASRSVISKLILASSTYFIWQERNEHLFKSHKRTVAQVIECIMSAVRLKLVSCRFKNRWHVILSLVVQARLEVNVEKGFAIAALKNELRKLKGNSVDTKFVKPSILGKPVLLSLRNQSFVRQPTAFKFERPRISKPRFASQVDMKHVLSKPVTSHYLPKERESAVVKPNHVIESSKSRNSSKNMTIFSSNDMVHNHYLEEAKKKT